MNLDSGSKIASVRILILLILGKFFYNNYFIATANNLKILTYL
jgi:hypothetical protein